MAQDNCVGKLIEAFLGLHRTAHGKISPTAAVDNSFSVLVMQAMSDIYISHYKASKEKEGEAANELLACWADEAAAALNNKPEPLAPWLDGLAKLRVVVMEAALNLAKAQAAAEADESVTEVAMSPLLRSSAEKLLAVCINPAEKDEALRSVELYFMKHLAKEIGMQQAILVLMGDRFSTSVLKCDRLGLGNILNPRIGGHIPSTDPFYFIYEAEDYGELRLKSRVALCNGQTGIDGIEETVNAGEGKKPRDLPALVMALHYEGLLGKRSLEERPGAGIISGSAATQNAELIVKSIKKLFPGDELSVELVSCMLGAATTRTLAPPFALFEGVTLEDSLVLQPAFHLAAKALSCEARGEPIGPWFKLLIDPFALKEKLIPAMPEDEFAMLIAAVGGGETLGVYKCACGYKYVIADCTMPNATTKCPDCGKDIGAKRGGGFHTLTDTSTRIAVTGRTHWNTGQAANGVGAEDVGLLGEEDAPPGYSPPDDSKEPSTAEQFRELTPLSYRILRYMIHGCLALACAVDFGGRSKASCEKLCPGSTMKELVSRMKADFRLIKKLADSCTSEDAYFYLHMIIGSMDTETTQADWSTDAKTRAKGERCFQDKIVRTLFGNDEVTKQTRDKFGRIKAGAEGGKLQLGLGAELAEAKPAEPSGLPRLLRYRQPITLAGFQFKLQTTASTDFPILDAFVNNAEELDMAGDLYPLLRMSGMVHKRYGGCKTRAGAETTSFMDAIKQVPEEEEAWAKAFIAFRRVYNKWAPKVGAFQCHQLGKGGTAWSGMPYMKHPSEEGPRVTSDGHYTQSDSHSWEAAAEAKSIKLGLIDVFDHTGPSATDPESCMLKLLIERMIQAHNDKFIKDARNAMAARGRDESPVLPLSLVTASDMIAWDKEEFEGVIRGSSAQSIKFGQGGAISYNFGLVEEWVYENVVANVPLLDDTMPVFPWVGESSDEYKANIGGIEQVPIPGEISGTILHNELPSLVQLQDAMDKLDECIGFMVNLTADDPELNFAAYCADALRMSEAQLSVFGSPSSAFRTAVRLKHLSSLREAIDDTINPTTEPPETMDTIYREVLTAEVEEKLKAAYSVVGKEFMTVLCKAYLDLLHAQFKDFAQPCALESYGAPSPIKSPYMMAPLDFASTGSPPNEGNLMDFDWYNECEELDDIPIANLYEVYQFLSRLLKEDEA